MGKTGQDLTRVDTAWLRLEGPDQPDDVVGAASVRPAADAARR
jgi:hypothetical protein